MIRNKILMGTCVILILSIGITLSVSAQSYENDPIKEEMIAFLKENENLEDLANWKDYSKRIQVIELVSKIPYDYAGEGVFAFSINNSHAKEYLLVKEAKRHKILDPSKFQSTLKYLSEYLGRTGKVDTIQAKYVGGFMDIYWANANRNPAQLKR